ncbi:hypothetical protein RvY_07871 [Ramazzottius varieornatus]|uniref:HMG box domain-containing protein n=1 Tax=Ramazzottius varieornatus TaxID=947166 RepID=A0A1D1V6C9_RAMVA|nr:hypothetical protein RvY_07871 [Ramazzottius varieornatus]
MPKIPGKPQGRLSAYAFFLKISRDELKQKFPGAHISFGEFSKKCSEKWKSMDDQAKGRFVHLATRDKERHKLEMAQYGPAVKVGKGSLGGKVKRPKRDENAPKKPLTAFFWFCHDERANAKAAVGAVGLPISVGDIAKELGRRWAVVSAERKDRYDRLAAKDKERYEKEMEVYKQQMAGGFHAPSLLTTE